MTLKIYECPECGRDGDRFKTTEEIARYIAEGRDACAHVPGDNVGGTVYFHESP